MAHHRTGLVRLLDDLAGGEADWFIERLLAHVVHERPLPPGVTSRERAIAAYTLKLTREPAAMQQADLAPLRAAGLDDAEILDCAHVAGYYAYANRIADGLGIALEPYRS